MTFYLYILLSIVVLQSCFTNKKISQIKHIDYQTESSQKQDTNAIILDISHPIVLKSQLDKREENKGNDIGINIETKSSKVYNIINYIDTTKLLDNNFGIIAYNVPQIFKVNKYSTIKLRISKEKSVESVVVGNRNIPIVGTGSDDNVILETIKIDEYITAKLYTDEGIFEVELVSTPNQRISEDGYTEWIWRVRPLKSGTHYIKMLISLSDKDIVVYEKDIMVESDISWSFSNWFVKWWQVIMTTIITPILIPFIIWLWKKKKSE